LMIKGRHIDGEIATNRHMRARGITCAVHDALGASGSPDGCPGPGPAPSCTSCADCTAHASRTPSAPHCGEAV
jgi:hypothetical protein